MANETYLTKEGYDKLKAELGYLKGTKRKKVARALEEARALGDLSENAEYDAAKQEQSLLEARVAELELKLGNARILDTTDLPSDRVCVGVTVTLQDEDGGRHTYRLVVPDEADIAEGKVSTLSPLGKGLMGKREGEGAVVLSPSGERRFTVISIER